MDGHKERAFQYRQKAEELREMIPDMTDDHTRDTLENIARGHDRSRTFRRISRGQRNSGPRSPEFQTETAAP